MKFKLVGVVGAAALTAGVALPAAGSAFATASPRGGGHGHSWQHRSGLDHVFIIMEENHAQDHIIGDPSMPYLNSLAQTYGQATDYYGVTHTSEPNYIAATSGDNWGNNDDDGWYSGNHYPDPSIAGNHFDHTNIVDELQAAHISWGAYMDAMPSAGYQGDNWPADKNQLYAVKHNPFMLYNDIRFNPYRRANVKPYTSLAADLNSWHAPRYVWISPDNCNNMHGGVYTPVAGFPESDNCGYSDVAGDAQDETLKAQADAFIKNAVQTIMSSKAWTGNSVIFITADENDYDADNPDIGDYLSDAGCCDSPVLPPGDPYVSPNFPGGTYGGGLVPMVVVTTHGPHHVTDATAYNHYSMLLTIEEGFGLGKLGNTSDSAQVKPMWPLIKR